MSSLISVIIHSSLAILSELSAAQLVLVRGRAERSDCEFTVEMIQNVPAFQEKKSVLANSGLYQNVSKCASFS